jgi:hypothetical protein
MSLYSFEIGLTQGGMTNLEALATKVTPPAWTYQVYSEEVELGDGSMLGSGWPTAEWHWGFIKKAEKEMLRTFCPGKSAEVYIKTYKPDRTSAVFKAIMVWPQAEDDYAERTLSFVITFRRLEVAA